ncbi:MAG: phosphomevalonate decarboxylase MvaD [Halobacteriaceae archaeon]
MKATARAHPIQGLVKYHGMRDHDLRYPYHDSISVCTAPSATTTTAAFDSDRESDHYVVDGEVVTGTGADRIRSVVDRVRDLAGLDTRVRLESENSFPTNVGLGSSASGFAAAAVAAAAAADLELSHPELSAIARRGSASAARAVAGGFADLRAGVNDEDCRAYRLDPGGDLADMRVVVGLVPAYKETQAAHDEAEESHMWEARLAHVHGELQRARDAIRAGDLERVGDIAERDTLSLAATTMTGPAAWVYWKPETLAVFETVRDLREDGVPAYFSVDTGATVYVNTTDAHVDRVAEAVADCGVETRRWRVGGPARVIDGDEALF